MTDLDCVIVGDIDRDLLYVLDTVAERVIGGVVGIGDPDMVTVCDTVIEILVVPERVIGGVVGIADTEILIVPDGVAG